MPSPRTKPSRTSLVAFGMLVLVALYVLAPGPAIAIANAVDAELPEELGTCLATLYQPLEWCGENSEGFAEIYSWYMELWY